MSILSIGSIKDLDFEQWIVLSLLVLVGVALTRALEWVWWRPKRLERILRQQGIRGNPYKPLIGDIRDSMRMTEEAKTKPLPIGSHDIAPRVIPALVKAIKDHGDMSITWFSRHPRVIISDPELIKEILSTKFGHFGKQKINPIARALVSGLVGYDGEKWAKHRRIINPAFHVEKIKHMHPAFSACCSKLIERLDDLAGIEGFVELDVRHELQNLTGDVISQSAFGSSYEEGRRIFLLQEEQGQLLVEAVRNIYIPGYRFFPTRLNKRRIEIEKEVRSLLRTIIEKREKTMKAGIKCDDLLGYLMESNLKHLQESENSEKTGMTIDEVIDECKLFYFAGQETTTNLLTWTMILLCMHPTWQERAREEVFRIFGKNKPDSDGLSHLKTVTMVLYEVLRLYPPALFLIRSAYKDIQLGKFIMPKGVQFLLPILLVHHDPRYWGEDAKEFKPERFAEGVAKASKSQMAFFPFSGGPRVCIGQGFAMAEAKLALCMILQNFSFELSPTYVHAPHTIITLQPQYGAQIILRRIGQ